MKKYLIVSFILVFTMVSGAIAQQKPFVFGFKAGPNLGWMNPDTRDYDNDGVKVGFSWGFTADFFIMENYSFASGFDVVFLNGRIEMPHKVDIDSITVNEGKLYRTYHLKYIQVPVTLKMRTNELGKFRIFGQIGLGTNFLIGAKADDEFIYGRESDTENEIDIYDDMKFMRESLIIGGGVEYSLGGSTSIMASLLFNNGFTNILKGYNSVDGSLKNKAQANYISLEVGIVF